MYIVGTLEYTSPVAVNAATPQLCIELWPHPEARLQGLESINFVTTVNKSHVQVRQKGRIHADSQVRLGC